MADEIMRREMISSLKTLLFATPAFLAYALFSVLPLGLSRRIGSALAYSIGPRLPAHLVAKRNLALALPELSVSQQQESLRQMWQGFGRILAEFPKLGTASFLPFISPDDALLLQQLHRASKRIIVITGHISHWECVALCAHQAGVPLSVMYRPANNRLVNRLIIKIRSRYVKAAFAKGSTGVRQIIRALQQGQPVGMLVDQKENRGVALPFFHAPAMTSLLCVQLARKMGAVLLQARILRGENDVYRMQLLSIDCSSGMNQADDALVMQRIHHQFEAWIRERPHDWFWVHQRWQDRNST
ncbi:MAG: hypothetical protein K2Q12_04345 [Rickettsiales bacterium]|nr:hypothetical protein [Rickettsiales bacterium]